MNKNQSNIDFEMDMLNQKINELQTENERLQRERDALREETITAYYRCIKLGKTLQPFADYISQVADGEPDDQQITSSIFTDTPHLTVGHIRAAASALGYEIEQPAVDGGEE